MAAVREKVMWQVVAVACWRAGAQGLCTCKRERVQTRARRVHARDRLHAAGGGRSRASIRESAGCGAGYQGSPDDFPPADRMVETPSVAEQ